MPRRPGRQDILYACSSRFKSSKGRRINETKQIKTPKKKTKKKKKHLTGKRGQLTEQMSG